MDFGLFFDFIFFTLEGCCFWGFGFWGFVLICQIELRRLSILWPKTQYDKILRRDGKYALQENVFLCFAIDGYFFGFVIFLGGGWSFCHMVIGGASGLWL